jgi:hypothetical protein
VDRAMIEPLNPWLDVTIKRASRLVEDSDRKTFAASRFAELIRRVHELGTRSAIRIGAPELERTQDEDSVTLWMGWLDKSSGWQLYFGVQRKLGEKPTTYLDFFGNPQNYSCDKPTDDDVRKALNDYFEGWKKETTG